MDSSGRNVIISQKDLPEKILSRRAGYRAWKKWSFSECLNIMKRIPSERARRIENVGFGITWFGVTVEKIRPFVP
jgi:hypothetical protein